MMIDDIISEHIRLNNELLTALSTMEKTNKIFEIRQQLINLQKQCPHMSEVYNWTSTDGHTCPYCGKNIVEGEKK